jgi:hypothetical protein
MLMGSRLCSRLIFGLYLMRVFGSTYSISMALLQAAMSVVFPLGLKKDVQGRDNLLSFVTRLA